MKPTLSKDGKFVLIAKLTARGKRTVYMPVKSFKIQQKRARNRCRVRVVIDGKSRDVDPMAILFGPDHRNVNPKADASWSPATNDAYNKKWT